MSSINEKCPTLDSGRFTLGFVNMDDINDLLEVYSDKNALPFFNSDNCDGDNFYYPDLEKMKSAVGFWLRSYETKWFVRWAVIDKGISKAIERTDAAIKYGFTKSNKYLIGANDHYAFNGYWTIKRPE